MSPRVLDRRRLKRMCQRALYAKTSIENLGNEAIHLDELPDDQQLELQRLFDEAHGLLARASAILVNEIELRESIEAER